MEYLFQPLRTWHIQVISIAELVDNILTKRLNQWCHVHQIKIVELPTPKFLTPWDWFQEQLPPQPLYSLTKFDIAQRRRLRILVEGGNPSAANGAVTQTIAKNYPKIFRFPQ